MCRRRCLLLFLLLCLGAPTWTQEEEQSDGQGQSVTEGVESGVAEGNSSQSQGTDARTSGNIDSDQDGIDPESHSQSAGPGSSPQEGVASKKEDREIVRFIPELAPNIVNPGRLSNGSWYIMFYASWCEYSQEAMPHFLEVFQHIVDTNTSGVYIGKIEVTKHGDVAKHFKIKATPTFIFFKLGTRHEFDSVMTAENLKDFMIRLLRSEVSQVNTSQQLVELQRTHPVIYILADEGELDPDWKAIYMKLANEKILRARYLYTTNPDVLKEFHVPSFPAILVIKEGSAYPFKGALSDYSLSRWLALERFSAFPSINATTVHPYLRLSLGRKLGVLVVDDDPAKRRVAQRKAIEIVRKVAESRKLHKSFQFILLESVEIGERLTQGHLELPALFVFEHYTSYYYPYKPSEDEKGMTEKSVISFLNDVIHNKVQPQGGPSFYYTLIRIRERIYATVQTMITHQPVLSLVAVLSLLGMVLFYATVYCNRSPKKHRVPRRMIRQRQRANKPQRDSCNSVRQRHKEEKEEQEEQEEEGESTGGSASDSASFSETESRKDK